MEAINDHVEETKQTVESAERHLYYRRCAQLRKNGEQCMGPAMKGETVCYSHFNQAELARFRQQERQKFLGALLATAGPGFGPEVNRALQQISQALYRGHIDLKTAGKLMLEVQKIMKEAKRRR